MAGMTMNEIIYPVTRNDWREWLQTHFKDKKEVWIAIPKKDRKFDYNDIAEEALCFNWIDSTQKVLNADYTALRMSPRRKNGGFSQLNLERIRLLVENDQVHPDFKEALYAVANEAFHFSKDILDRIKKNKDAWKHYQVFPEPYKRLRIASIESVRDDQALFEKRLQKFIEQTILNKMVPGISGMEKYYL